MAGFKKRTYGGTMSRRPFKRTKRTFRKRRFGKKSGGFTSQSGGGQVFAFSAKRINKRRWKNILWTSTLQKQHYRSLGATVSIIGTQAATTVGTLAIINADDNGTAPFWQAAGGAVTPDAGTVITPFTHDLVRRGGTLGIVFSNTIVEDDPIRVQLWLVRSGDLYDPTVLPATAFIGFDPTVVPDFNSRIGKIVRSYNFLIENSKVAEYKYRLPIEKIDQTDYVDGKRRYYWIINCANTGAVLPQNLRVSHYFNVSFTGDNI